MIVNLYKAKKQQQPGMKYKELMASISADSGIGMRKVIQTISEYKNTGECKSPNKTKIRPTIIDKIDDFNKNAIRQKIHGFWLRNEIPTTKKIVQAINDDPDLPNLPSTSLRRVLKELNFEFTKINRNSALTERADLVVWRQKYIEDIRRYRDEGRTIYFLDETWVNAGQCSSKVSIDTSVKSHTDAFLKGLTTGPKNPSGEGKRLIVVHIGSADGFVEGGLLCFESKKNTADYHDEMNGDTFYDWFCGVLPRLKDNCVIVMDNASYHSVKKDPVPTTTWKKEDIQNWLKSKGVVLDKPMVKFRLLDMVNEIRPRHDKYVIDELAKQYDCIILRLPPYHCELNAIELAWPLVKNYVSMNNTTFKLADVKQLLIEGAERVKPTIWKNLISQTKAEEDKLWKIDFIVDYVLSAEVGTLTTTNGDTSSDDSSITSD
ncbi:uncharacterized protein LOC132951224 isoform X2 [Metopolophium dirhodum]|nr:uncharacterized protein LOC132951224 isoform X2 [Metopolophium dirhodum]